MRRLLSVLTATLVAMSMLIAPAYAKDNGGKGDSGGGRGGSPSGSGKGEGQSAGGKANAPGQTSKGAAAAQDGSLAPQLSGVRAGSRANVVEVNGRMNAKRRAALKKSLASKQAGLTRLRSGLVRLGLSGLSARDAGDAIATRREPDGSLTVFVDRAAN